MFIVRMTALLLTISVLYCGGYYAQEKRDITQREIIKGVVHKKIVDAHNTLIINILEIDMSGGEFEIFTGQAGETIYGRKTTSKILEAEIQNGTDAIAAINADFFMSDGGGEPCNNVIRKGEIFKGNSDSDHSIFKRGFIPSQFAVGKNGKPYIEKFVLDSKIILKGNIELKLKRINSRTDTNSITLYNKRQGDKTPCNDKAEKKTEIRLFEAGKKRDTLIFIAAGKYGECSNEIGDNDWFLTSRDSLSEVLNMLISEGDTIKVISDFLPKTGELYTLIGGWPRLVLDGKNTAEESQTLEATSRNFAILCHPRTGVGFSEDSSKIFFFVVDGRQSKSRGMGLSEFADLMIAEGVYQGVNLDGGGSSVMVIAGEIVSNPSDLAGERAVTNCLILAKKK